MNDSQRSLILMVDDNPDNLRVLMETLKQDYDLAGATDGEKALKMAAAERVPDLILLDVCMPGLTGFGVCKCLKSDPKTCDIPVIFVTALGQASDEEQGLSLGAIDYITKPFNPSLVRARVANHIALRRAIRLKEEVDRIIAHDVKTPVTNLLSLPGILLLNETIDEESRSLIQLIEDSAYTVAGTINLSLDLYKMEQGIYYLDPIPVNLVRIIGRIISQNEFIISSKQTQVMILVDDIPASPSDIFEVMGEELLCHAMISNLLLNALEATPAREQITINMKKTGDKALISIHNKGIVPEAVREHFFDKYTTCGKEKGTGIGTYSAKLLARNQDGDISFETSDELGTTITIEMPVER